MACYSSSFKDREEKRKETLKTWENFNYYDLSYDLKACSVSGGIARAKVEWRIRSIPVAGGQPEEGKSVLSVIFRKEKNEWKIKEVTPIR